MELLDDESQDGCYCTDEELERLVREAMPSAGRPRGAATTVRPIAGNAAGAAAKAIPGTPTSQPVDPPGLAMPAAG
eukprot:1264233-Lingulodinium_polyedra.AAC.1